MSAVIERTRPTSRRSASLVATEDGVHDIIGSQDLAPLQARAAAAAVTHAGAVLRILIQDQNTSNAAIGAYVAVWLDRATARPNMPLPALHLAAQITLMAVAPQRLPIPAARRLWNIHFGVVEAVHGAPAPKDCVVALARIAREAGSLDKRAARDGMAPELKLGERLMLGLDMGSEAWVALSRDYLVGRR